MEKNYCVSFRAEKENGCGFSQAGGGTLKEIYSRLSFYIQKGFVLSNVTIIRR